MHMQAHLIEVLKSTIKGTSHPILDCASLYHNVLLARRDTSNTFRELSQRLLASGQISRTLRACESQPLAFILPKSGRNYLEPSEILPVNTYAPEPNQQCCNCTPSRTDSYGTVNNDRSTGDTSNLDQELPALFNVTPISLAEPRRIHCLAPLVEFLPSPTEYPAAVEDLQRSLVLLSTDQNNEFAGERVPVTSGSAALLARQLRHSASYAETTSSKHVSASPPLWLSRARGSAYRSGKPNCLSVPSRASRGEHNSCHKLHQSNELPKAPVVDHEPEPLGHEVQAEYPIMPKSSLDTEPMSLATITDPREVAFDFNTYVNDIPSPLIRAGSAQSWNRDRTTGLPGTTSPLVDRQGSKRFESKRWSSLHDTPSCNTFHKLTDIHTGTWSVPPALNQAGQHMLTRTYSAILPPTPSQRNTMNISVFPAICSTAQLLQSSPRNARWQMHFTFAHNSSNMVCNTCDSSIPTEPFNVRCKSSVW